MRFELTRGSSYATLELPAVSSSVILLSLQLLNGIIQILIKFQLLISLTAILPKVEKWASIVRLNCGLLVDLFVLLDYLLLGLIPLLLLARMTVSLRDLCSLWLGFRFCYNAMLLLQRVDWLVHWLNLFLHHYWIFENEIVCL